MRLKWVLVLIALFGLVLVWYGARHFILKERVKDLLVKTACADGELDNYFNNEPVQNIQTIYERMRPSFSQFKVKDQHLISYGGGTRKKIFRFSTWVGEHIIEECGSPTRTLHQARHLTSLLIRTARLSASR